MRITPLLIPCSRQAEHRQEEEFIPLRKNQGPPNFFCGGLPVPAGRKYGRLSRGPRPRKPARFQKNPPSPWPLLSFPNLSSPWLTPEMKGALGLTRKGKELNRGTILFEPPPAPPKNWIFLRPAGTGGYQRRKFIRNCFRYEMDYPAAADNLRPPLSFSDFALVAARTPLLWNAPWLRLSGIIKY